MPVVGAIGTPRPSCVVSVDRAGVVTGVALTDTDNAIVAAIPEAVRVIAVDAPLVVPNARGARPQDQLLQWLEVSVFPVSADRMRTVFGGARGVGMAAALQRRADRVYEAVPDLVLRELAWESSRAAEAPVPELEDYRAAWLGIRPPRYRPKGTGRARPAGIPDALALLAVELDPAGWVPRHNPDDWQAIADAAVIDALAAALTARRAVVDPGSVVVVGDGPVPVAFPGDANLHARARINGARMGVPVSCAVASDGDGA